MKKALVVLSGGQDSTTCLFWAKQRFDVVHCITFNYGQRHQIELDAADTVASLADVLPTHHRFVTVGNILESTSPLVDQKAKLEKYKDAQSLPGGLEKTFVPGRNMLFAVLAANHAYALGITDIVMGVCEEDYGGYPDCRETFIIAVEKAIRAGFGYDDSDPFTAFEIHTPLMHMTKAESVEFAHSMPKCWEALAFTHTAYDGKYPPIGKDHASLLRAKGFEEAGLPDPLVLRAVYEELMKVPKTANYDETRAILAEQNGE